MTPMHYRGENFGFGVLSTLDAFTDLFPAETVHRLAGPTFSLTADTAGVVVPTPKLLG